MNNNKEMLKSFADKHGIEFNKIKVYQNLKFFFHPSLNYEYINPNHKVLLKGKRKGTHRQRHTHNEEKIALFMRQYYPYYILACYIVLGVTLFKSL